MLGTHWWQNNLKEYGMLGTHWRQNNLNEYDMPGNHLSEVHETLYIARS
jgi:hypothetical protein